MSKRRKPGDWVWPSPGSGFIQNSHRLRVEIQPEDEDAFDYCCLDCGDPDCRCWANSLTEPDPKREGYRHMLHHVSECEMYDEKQPDPKIPEGAEHMFHTPIQLEKLKTDILGPQRNLAIRRILLPQDTNPRGEIFGGSILKEIDLAGAFEARQHTKHDVATRFMNGIEFKHPVAVGDVVSLYTELVKIGTTSITVKVEVEFSRDGAKAPVAVVATEVVYVAIKRNEDGTISKVPVRGF